MVRLAHFSNNISCSCAYGIFTSQIIRFFRICNSYDSFIYRVKIMFNSLISLGYNKTALVKKFRYIGNKHNMNNKFHNLDFSLVALSH